MPNHVKTTVCVVGETDEVRKFREDFIYKNAEINHDEAFNLDKIIPQPENIYQENLTREKKLELDAANIPNWYDWNCENWGTKWNTYSFDSHGVDDYGRVDDCGKYTRYTFEFQSAWSEPCDNIWIKLSEMFPNLMFFCRADGERDSVRIWVIKNLKIESDDEYNFIPDIQDMAYNEMWERDYYEKRTQG